MKFPEYIINYIKSCLDKRNHYNEKYAKQYMNEEVKTYLTEHDVTSRCLCITYTNSLEQFPRCLYCNKPLNSIHHNKKYCDSLCAKNDKKRSIEKRKKTCLEKYGVDNPSKNKEVKEKIKNTNVERYGVTSPAQSKEIKEKIEKTNLIKYGVKCVFQNENIKNEIQNKLKTVDKESLFKKKWTTHRIHYYDKFKIMLLNKQIECLTSKEDFVREKEITCKCLKCKLEFKTSHTNPREICCPEYTSHYSKVSSKAEKDIVTYIKSIYDKEILENNKNIITNKELDIYIPDKNVAIEYNGSYWHSDLFVDKNYHLNKTLECRDKGIRLIHIFEYEWENKREICHSIIASALGIYKQKIYARNCHVENISSVTYRNFLEENHIQGSINSSLRLGLFHEGELVSVIGFGKSRFKNGEYELHRFCTKLHTQVLGGFSKLIKHSGVKEFISYIDLSKFNGYGYISTGFKILEYTEPSYVYVKGNVIYKRMSCQKHKLHKILENYDENKTEYDNMIANNYYRVYDCGNIKVKYQC